MLSLQKEHMHKYGAKALLLTYGRFQTSTCYKRWLPNFKGCDHTHSPRHNELVAFFVICWFRFKLPNCKQIKTSNNRCTRCSKINKVSLLDQSKFTGFVFQSNMTLIGAAVQTEVHPQSFLLLCHTLKAWLTPGDQIVSVSASSYPVKSFVSLCYLQFSQFLTPTHSLLEELIYLRNFSVRVVQKTFNDIILKWIDLIPGRKKKKKLALITSSSS